MTSHRISSITGSDSDFGELFGLIFGFSPLDMAVLKILLKRSSPMTLEDMAGAVDRDKSTVFKSLQRLVSSGLCTKEVRNLREGGYYHLYGCSGIEKISKNTKLKVEEVQAGLTTLLKKFEDEMKSLAQTRSLRILIAEDEKDISAAYKMVLQERGHEVVLTQDGEKCLEVYKESITRSSGAGEEVRNEFDVVLLDYRMPGMNGMDVAKTILSLNPSQRIIFASAYAKDTLVEAIKELKQVVELLQKPFDADALVQAVEDVEVRESLNRLLINLSQADLEDPDHRAVNEIFGALRLIQKAKTF